MAVFTIQAPDGRKIKIEAADEATAMRGAQEWAAANPAVGGTLQGDMSNRKASFNERSNNIEDRREPPRPDLMTATANTISGITNSIPVIGPLAQGIVDNVGGHISQAMGGDFDDPRKRREELIERDPVAYGAGNIAGGIGSFGVGGMSQAGAQALGMAGRMLPGFTRAGGLELGQMASSGLSMLGIGTADNMARGQAPDEALGNAAAPAALATAIPGVGHLARAGGRAVMDNVVNPLRSAINPENAAIRAVSRGVAQDAATAPALTQAGERAVRGVGGEVVNADRFGSAIRTLSRTASNMSPQADNALRGMTEQRFLTQGNRATDFVRRLMGGATDDLALQDTLRTAAQQSNAAGYNAARANPNSRAIWNQPIRELMQSDTFRRAIQAAETKGTDRAAVAGVRAVRNPFEFRPDGSVTLRQDANGSRALPSLDFWDQVKRNLDRMIDDVRPTPLGGGNRTDFSDLTQIKRKLVAALDEAVPEYRSARQGAAGFFGAEDAIDAGRRAAMTTRQVPEMERAVGRMSTAERDAFSVGYASELIDRINASRDRVNVINSVFGSQEARQKAAIALGPQRARELEAYVRAEQALQMLREAVGGNSTTARQLLQAGVLPAAGFGVGWMGSGGDLGSAGGLAFLVSAGRSGMKALGRSTDERVMQRVAEMLVSGDPTQVQRAIQNAALSRQHMELMEAFARGLDIAGRGTVSGSSSIPKPSPQPLEITVRGGATAP